MHGTKRPFDEDQPSCDESTKHPRIADQNNSNQVVKVDSSKSTQTSVSDKDILSLNGRTQESQNQNNGTTKSNDMKASNLLKNIIKESLQTEMNSARPTECSDNSKNETDQGTFTNDSTNTICKIVKVEGAHSSGKQDENTRQQASTLPAEPLTSKQHEKITQHISSVQQNVLQLGNGVSVTNISIPARVLSTPFTIPVSVATTVATRLPGSNIIYLRPAGGCNNVSNGQPGVLTPIKEVTNVTSNCEIGSKNKVEKTLGLPSTSQRSPLGTSGDTIRSVYYLSANVKNMSLTNSKKNEDPSPNIMPGTNITYKSRSTNYRNRNGNIKRPMNAFMLWARNYRRNLSQSMPAATNAEISVRLGQVWASLASKEKEQYYKEAEKIKLQHRINFPGWVYKPNQTKKDVDTQHARLWQKYGTKRSKTEVAQQSKVDSKSSSCQTDTSITYPESTSTSTSSTDSSSESQENIPSTRHPATDKPEASTVRRGRPPSVTKRVEESSLKDQCKQKRQQYNGKTGEDKQSKERSGNRKTKSKSGNEEKHLDKGSVNTKEKRQIDKGCGKAKETMQLDKGCDQTNQKRQQDKGCNQTNQKRQQDKGCDQTNQKRQQDKGCDQTNQKRQQDKGCNLTNQKRQQDKGCDQTYEKRQQDKGCDQTNQKRQQDKGCNLTNEKRQQDKGCDQTNQKRQQDKGCDQTNQKRQQDKGCDQTNQKRQQDKGCDQTNQKRQQDKGYDQTNQKRQQDKGCNKANEKRQQSKGCDKRKEKRQLDKGCDKPKSKTSHLKRPDFHRKQTPNATSANKMHFQSNDVKSLDKADTAKTKEEAPSTSAKDTNSELWPFPFPTIDHDVQAEVLVEDELRDERRIDKEYMDPYRPFYYNSNEDNDRKAGTYQVDVSRWQKYLNDTNCEMDSNKTKSNKFTPIIKAEKDGDVQKSQSDLDICPTPVAVTLRRNYPSVGSPETSTSKLHIKSGERQLSGRTKTNDKHFRPFNREGENINYNACAEQKETTSEFASSFTSAINVLEDNDVEYCKSTSYPINIKTELNKNASTTGYVSKSKDTRPLKKRTERFMRDFLIDVKGNSQPNVSALKTNDGISGSSAPTVLTGDRSNGVGDSNSSNTVTSTNHCNTSAGSSSFQGDL